MTSDHCDAIDAWQYDVLAGIGKMQDLIHHEAAAAAQYLKVGFLV
jgi:hypothetical protein